MSAKIVSKTNDLYKIIWSTFQSRIIFKFNGTNNFIRNSRDLSTPDEIFVENNFISELFHLGGNNSQVTSSGI